MGYINFLRPGNPALSVVVQPIKLGRDVIGGSLLFSPRALTLLTLLHYTGMCVMSNEKGEEEADQWARTRLPINNILRHLSSSDTTTGRFENHFVHGGGGDATYRILTSLDVWPYQENIFIRYAKLFSQKTVFSIPGVGTVEY